MTRKTGALIAGLAAGLSLLAMADVASAQAAGVAGVASQGSLVLALLARSVTAAAWGR